MGEPRAAVEAQALQPAGGQRRRRVPDRRRYASGQARHCNADCRRLSLLLDLKTATIPDYYPDS